MILHIRNRRAAIAKRLQVAAAAVAGAVRSNVGELLLTAALGFIAHGCWQVWRPGATLIPGLVLLWIALPQRRAFIERPKPPTKLTRRQQLQLQVREGRD